jgi:hypothetical protein
MTIKVINENNNITVTPQDTNVIISTGGTNVANSTTNTTNIATNTANIATNTDNIAANTADIIINETNISSVQTALNAIETGPTYTAGTNISISATNEISSTASGGATAAQVTAITANTAKVGITTGQATAISANTTKVGITPEQATAISNNTLKVGITPEQATAITANTLKVSNVVHPLVQTAVPANAVFTDTIGATGDQIAEIAANNNKVGITAAQASEIIANNAKIGITAAQASEIIANNAKIGITPAQSLRLSNVGKNVPDETTNPNDVAFMIVMGSMNATGDPEGVGKPGSSTLSSEINVMKEGKYFFSAYSKNNNNVFSAQHNKINVFSQIANEWKNRKTIDSTLPKLNIINCSYENNGFNIANYSLGNYSSDSKWDIFLRQDNGTSHFTIPEDIVNTNNSLFYTAQKAIRSALIGFAKEGKRAFHVGTVWNGFEQEMDTDDYGLNAYPANIRFVRNMVDEALGLVDSDFYIWKPMSPSSDFSSSLSKLKDMTTDLSLSENNVFLVNPEQFSNYSSTDSHLGLFNDHGSNSNAVIAATDKKYYNETSLNQGAIQVIDNFVTSGTGTETITRATAVCLDVKSLILSPKLLNGGNIYDHKLIRQTRFNSFGILDDINNAMYDATSNTTTFYLDTANADLYLPSGTTTVQVNGVSQNIISSINDYEIVVSGNQLSNSFDTGDNVTNTTESVNVEVLLNETDQTEE